MGSNREENRPRYGNAQQDHERIDARALRCASTSSDATCEVDGRAEAPQRRPNKLPVGRDTGATAGAPTTLGLEGAAPPDTPEL